VVTTRSEAVEGGLVHSFRLACYEFWVDVRVREFNGRWLAAADTVEGPSLGWSAFEGLWMALDPFDGVIDEWLAAVPEDVVDLAGIG
jgi:hypothetical protein